MKIEAFATTTFSMEKAESLAVLSDLAYDNPIMWEGFGFQDVEFFNKDGAQAYGAVKGGIVFIAFRGTEPDQLSDLIADAKAWKDEAVLGGKVHDGFQDELEKIWHDIRYWLMSYEGQQIYVTGHSLGAAMATIATSRLPEGTICYNFGSPRVGDQEFKDKFDATYELHRFVNNNDAVTGVPLKWMGFKHVGELHYMNTYGKIRKLTPWQRVKDRWRGTYYAIKNGTWFDGFYDHAMRYYVKNLRGVVRELTARNQST